MCSTGWLILLIFSIPVAGFSQSFDRSLSIRPDIPQSSIDSLNDYAWSIVRQSPDSAMKYAEAAIRQADQAGYQRGLIMGNTILGVLNKDRGFFDTSVEHYLVALRLAEATGDSLRVSACLNNLGAVKQQQKDFRAALAFFRRSLTIEKRLGKDKGQRSIRLYNLGEAYYELDSLEAATAYYYQSLLIEQELDNPDGIFYARLGIGKVDTRTGNHAKAWQEFQAALELALSIQNQPGICEAQLAIGRHYMALKKSAEAIQHFENAQQLSKTYGYQSLETEALRGLSDAHKLSGNFEQAYAYLEAFYALNNSLNSASVASRIGDMQARYQLQKKEQQIAFLEQQEVIRKNEVKYERKLRNYLLFTIGIALLLILFNYLNRRKLVKQEHGQG